MYNWITRLTKHKDLHFYNNNKISMLIKINNQLLTIINKLIVNNTSKSNNLINKIRYLNNINNCNNLINKNWYYKTRHNNSNNKINKSKY